MSRREAPGGSGALLPTPAGGAESREADDVLLQLAEQLLRTTDPEEVGSALLEFAVSTYGFPRGMVLHFSGRQNMLLAGHAVNDTGVVGGSAAIDRAREQRSAQVVAPLQLEDEPHLGQLLPPGIDLLVLPLVHDDRALGALVLQIPAVLRGRRGRRMLAQLERCAGYTGSALSRALRLVQLERLAATDDLTKIANRRSLFAALEREIARSARRDEPVSLVMLDLDGFKLINDVHGHPAGDEALRNIAAALSIACRDLDTPARYGGEEFAVILPDCTTESGQIIAERLRQAIAAAPAVTSLTASAGLATLPDHANDAESLVAAADAALLEAKRGGRNRTVLATAVVDPARREAGSEETERGWRRRGSGGHDPTDAE